MPGITGSTGTKISYTPIGTGAVAVTMLFNATVHTRTPFRFAGFHTTDLQVAITRGGTHQSQVLDLWHTMVLGINTVSPEIHPLMWDFLANFWTHCSLGGVFSIAMTRERSAGLTFTGAQSQGDTVITVNEDPTGIPTLLKKGDIVRIENINEPLELQYSVLDVDATASPNLVTLVRKLDRDYPSGSKIFDAEHFPQCVSSQAPGSNPFRRRDAGRGGHWDFQMAFRTTRT